MSKKRHFISSITRLTLGGMLVVIEELDSRLTKLENDRQISEHPTPGPVREGRGSSENGSSTIQDGLVGAMLALGAQIDDRIEAADQKTRIRFNRTQEFFKPFTESWFGSWMTRQMDRLAARGEQEVSRFARYGKKELAQSKTNFRQAVSSSADEIVSHFADNPEVQQLVQTQGVSLAEEVIEEVRERTVSADDYLETVTRGIFKRPAREKMPEQPTDGTKQNKSQDRLKSGKPEA